MSQEKSNGKTQAQNPVESSDSLASIIALHSCIVVAGQ